MLKTYSIIVFNVTGREAAWAGSRSALGFVLSLKWQIALSSSAPSIQEAKGMNSPLF